MKDYNQFINEIKNDQNQVSDDLWQRIEKTIEDRQELKTSWDFSSWFISHPLLKGAVVAASLLLLIGISVNSYQTKQLNDYLTKQAYTMNSADYLYDSMGYDMWNSY